MFLAKINVMDYSLLVGIDEECNVIAFGIIDYIRQYTMDKQVRTPGLASPTVSAPGILHRN